MFLLESGGSSSEMRDNLQEVATTISTWTGQRDSAPESQSESAQMETRTQSIDANHNTTAAERRRSISRDESSVMGAQKRLQQPNPSDPPASKIDIRLLVRRREAGALIGKQGANIKRMRDQYKSSTFNIPDTGNGPERIVCISSESWSSLESILLEIGQLFLDKNCALNSTCEDQVELKQLINSAYAGLLIGMGGQSIRKLRNDSKAAIKIYEMCCPSSEERVCAIKARPPVVVGTIRMIHELMLASQASIKAPLLAQKPYDALNFDSHQVEKYGGHLADDGGPAASPASRACMSSFSGTLGDCHNQQHYFHRANTQHLIHFDPLDRTDGEAIPLVVSSPLMFRPGTFLSPVHAFDFAPLHPLADSHQFMPLRARKPWPRFSQVYPPQRPPPPPPPLPPQSAPNPAKIVQDHIYHHHQTFRAPPSAAQLSRSQRFHPYENQTHVRPAERATTRHRDLKTQADANRSSQQRHQATGRMVPEAEARSAASDERPAEEARDAGRNGGT